MWIKTNKVLKLFGENKISEKSDTDLEQQGCHGTEKAGNLDISFYRRGKHKEFAVDIRSKFFYTVLVHARDAMWQLLENSFLLRKWELKLLWCVQVV